ncbi:MAG: hypothetical protein MUC49_02155 [Raineya sp.]|jgi:hypothetical protein|nr:hypothetical protein [Raineya sp.]
MISRTIELTESEFKNLKESLQQLCCEELSIKSNTLVKLELIKIFSKKIAGKQYKPKMKLKLDLVELFALWCSMLLEPINLHKILTEAIHEHNTQLRKDGVLIPEQPEKQTSDINNFQFDQVKQMEDFLNHIFSSYSGPMAYEAFKVIYGAVSNSPYSLPSKSKTIN